MSNDISSVAASMDQRIRQLDYISNNLANASTTGFKAQHLRAMKIIEEAGVSEGNNLSGNILYTDFSQGLVQKTGNPLDLAIQGDGFFVVQTAEGQAFTRKSDFTVNRQNQIVTQAGDPVVGDGGPITLGNGKVNISSDGSVYVDGNSVGKLKIVDFSNRQALTNLGGGLYRDPGTAGMKPVDKPEVKVECLESSNVNLVKEMAEMIEVNRSFETYQKVIHTLSEEDKLSTSRVGRIG